MADSDVMDEVDQDHIEEDQGEVDQEAVETQEEPEAELQITIGSDEPDDDEDTAELGEKGRHALQAARKAQREAASEARKLKARIAEMEAERAPKVEEIKRPTLEECGFDDEAYARRVEEYVVAQAEVRARAAAQEAARKAEEDDYSERHGRYTAAKSALKVDGFGEAEEAVREALSREQQSILIRNLDDPAKMVYALGRSPKALAELAKVRDLDRFAYRLAKIEGEIKVTQKAPPPVESKLKGGAGATVATGTLSAQLAAAEKEAERTGDRTKVLSLRRQIQAAK